MPRSAADLAHRLGRPGEGHLVDLVSRPLGGNGTFDSGRDLIIGLTGTERGEQAIGLQVGDGDAFDGVLDLPHGHSCMVVPLRAREDALGIMTFDRKICEKYSDEVVDLAAVIGKLLAMSIGYGEQHPLW